VLFPYVNPATEMIDATNLPSAGDMQIAPIATATDGTQIWKITHNGVDTHPLHFHLFDVQVINRVTWDNIIIPPDLTELGWKDTVRTSPLEDTLVALRPVVPSLPFQIPNSIRPLNPMMPLGSTVGFNPVGPEGNAAPSINEKENFGWEYVWHCHILSHE
jgi:FtsP/CotA-like multicopper oxidase with cupredoxin domain